MGKRFVILFWGFCSFVLWCGCAKPPPPDAQLLFTPQRFKADTYLPDVSAFMVLMDCSGSMAEALKGESKIDLGKDFVYRMSLTLPGGDYHAVLRTFGHNPVVSLKNTRILYDGPYAPEAFHEAINRIGPAGGQSPMRQGLIAAGKDLENIKGDMALLVVSDGKVIGEQSIAIAKDLKETFGERLCIYPVMTGNSVYGRAQMDALAALGGCGFVGHAEAFMSKTGMGQYVSEVFLKKYPDTDGDGVDDRFDECPATPLEAQVDHRGCWVIDSIEYAFGQWEIRPEYYSLLDKVFLVLKQRPALKIQIQGHTDNQGEAEYNRELSLKRARAVKRYLVSRGINDERLSTAGFGETRPVASNQTEAGRKTNRRVELKPVSTTAE